MSIITTLPGIRGLLVYPFCYEIDQVLSAILSLFRFGYHVLALRSGGRKKELGVRERDTRISSRARPLSRPTSKRLLHSYMSRSFQAPP